MFSFASDLYLTYNLIRKLTKSFSDWDAFKLGVIDAEGNVLISKDKRTSEQKDSFRMFDVAVLNMKKLLAKLPGGSTKFATYAAALFLLKEPKKLNEEFDMDSIEEEMIVFIEEEFDNIMQYMNELNEEVVNSVGSGAIAGANSNDAFGHRVFDVDSDSMFKSKNGKHPNHRYKKYVGEDDTGEEIRTYGRKNPKKGIILRNKASGEMVFLRRGKKLNEAAPSTNTGSLDSGIGDDYQSLKGVMSAKTILRDLESNRVFDSRLSSRLKAHFDNHSEKSKTDHTKHMIRPKEFVNESFEKEVIPGLHIDFRKVASYMYADLIHIPSGKTIWKFNRSPILCGKKEFENRIKSSLSKYNFNTKEFYATKEMFETLNNVQISKVLTEDITMGDMQKLKSYVHNLFAQFKIDPIFTNHFIDRVNDSRNKPDINLEDLISVFNRQAQKNAGKMRQIGSNVDAVLKDVNSNINLPVYFEYIPAKKMLELRIKTVLRKKDFYTGSDDVILKS